MSALFILLLVTSPGKGPSDNPDSLQGKQRTDQQVKSEQKKDTATNFFQPSRPIPKEQQATADSERTAEENKNNSNTFWLLLFTVLGTWALAIVSGLALWRSRIDSAEQARLFRESNALSSDTAIRELRAYMSIELLFDMQAGPFPFIGESSITGPQFVIKNCGKTPAHSCNVRLNGGIGPPNPEESYFEEFANWDNPKGTVHPGYTHTLDPEPLSLKPGQLTGIKAGKAKVYYWGIISYRDAFKKDRWTRFRMESEWAQDPASERGWLTIPSFTLNGNDTEET